MPSDSSSPHIGAIVSLAGVALSILGLFLPMFIESQPMVPGSVHLVYEWSLFTPFLGVTGWFFVTLPWLGLLIVLATSVAALLRAPLPIPVWVKRVAAGGGLVFQFLLRMNKAQKKLQSRIGAHGSFLVFKR